MRRTGRLLIGGMLAGALIIGVASPGAAQSPEAADEKVVFTVGQNADITSINPFNLCCSWDYSYLIMVYDLAFGYGPDLSPAPNIVTAWEHSADYMDWTLTVRDDAVWHDGEPVTAEDVAFSFSLIADNKMPFYKDYLPFNPTFEVVDPTTVVWKSEQPTFAPEIPAYVPILPEAIWGDLVVEGDPKETKTAVKEFANDPPVGSGPFTLAEWNKDQFLRFEANPDYWGGTPASIDEVVVRIYKNQESLAQALRGGEIDFASGLTTTLYNTVIDDPNITGHIADGGYWNDIAFNFGGQGKSATNHPAIQDVRVRQAVSMAVNKDAIVEKVFQGVALAGDSVLMEGRNGFWYHQIPEDLSYSYDPDAANQVLDDAGYLDTDNDGVREMPDGTNPLVWQVMTISDVIGSVETGKLLRTYLDAIGIKAELFTVNQNKATDVWLSGDFDAYLWAWGSDPDPDFLLSVFTSGQCLGWSDGCFSNSEYDALYEKQRTQFDRDERKATIDQMQELLAEQIPVIVVAYQSNLEAYRNDRFEGYVNSPAVESGWLLFGFNNDSFMNLTPVGGEDGVVAAASSGLPGWVWALVVAGIALVVVVVIVARRGGGADEA